MKAAAVSVPTAGHVTTGVAIAIGLGAGLLAGLFGVGGGLIIVPGLLIFGRMDRRLAHGTSLGSTLIIAIASLLTYLAHGNVDWAIAALLAAGSVAGAVIGTHLLQIVPRAVLVYLFVAVVLAHGRPPDHDDRRQRATRPDDAHRAASCCSSGSSPARSPDCSASAAE